MDLLFSFKGRVGRKVYWLFFLSMFLLTAVAAVFDSAIGTEPGRIGWGLRLLMIAGLWPCFAIQAKRWHDRDKSGWWILINFVPVIGVIWALIENGLLPGTEGTNRFGEQPK